jgi:hypothetical protein
VRQIIGIGGRWLPVGGCHLQQLARPRNVLGARTIGKQTVVANAMEALRQQL